MATAAKTNSARVKGVSFRSVLQALESLRGSDFVRNCRERLSPGLAEKLQYEGLLASSWYPIEWYRELLDSARTTAGGEQILFQMGRQCMKQDTKGVYRAVFNLLSPQMVIRFSPRLFNNYYDTGTCSIVQAKTGFAQALWSGCAGFDRNMWCEIFGSAEMLLELAGALNLRARVVSGGREGDDFAELACHWSQSKHEPDYP